MMDKEVEQVIKKNEDSRPRSGFILPLDDDGSMNDKDQMDDIEQMDGDAEDEDEDEDED
jgi:hypothetical protein